MIRSPASCAARARRWKEWTSWGAYSQANSGRRPEARDWGKASVARGVRNRFASPRPLEPLDPWITSPAVLQPRSRAARPLGFFRVSRSSPDGAGRAFQIRRVPASGHRLARVSAAARRARSGGAVRRRHRILHDTGIAQAGERPTQGEAAAGGERAVDGTSPALRERAAEALAGGTR